MARILEMPEIAESVVEGEVMRWMVKEGDRVKREQPSPYEGTLLKIVAGEGQVVKVGRPLAVLGEPGEQVDLAALLGEVHGAAAGPPRAAAAPAAEIPGRVKAVPSIRKMAQDLGVDITTVRGMGPE